MLKSIQTNRKNDQKGMRLVNQHEECCASIHLFFVCEGMSVKEQEVTATEAAEAAAEAATETTAATEGTAATTTEGQKTKSQLKKERKIAARKEYWKAERARKREHYRAAKRQKMAEARARGEDMSEWVNKRRKKNNFWKAVDANGVGALATVAVDLGFGDEMSEKERKSAVNQLGYCYSANGTDYSACADLSAASAVPPCACAGLPEVASHVPHRCAGCLPGYFELVMTSFSGAIREAALRVDGSQHWRHVAWDARHYTDVFATQQRAGKLVYLTSEADDALLEIEPDTVYVIGGIVDHNRLKGLTHRDATARGVRTARLPLEETIDMASRKVLTINHCYEVLLAFANLRALQQRRAALGEQPLTAKQCWARAVTAVLPARKGAHSKEEDDEGEGSDDEEGSSTEGEAATATETAPTDAASDAPDVPEQEQEQK